MKNAFNNQVGMLGDMFLWLVANLKQGVIYFIKQAIPRNKSAGSVPRVAAAIGTHTCCVCAKVCPRLFLLEAAPNPISEKEEYTPALLVTKYSRVLILSWEKEYLQAQLPLNTTSHFLIRDLVGHLLEFIKISLAPPMLKIDNFS